MYLRQVRQAGVLGLVGYLVLAAGYLGMVGVEVMAAALLPGLASIDPAYVDDVIVASAGGTPSGDIGGMQTLFTLTGIGYLAGGLLFGIALFRTGILARWAAALLAVGAVEHRRARRAAGVVQPAHGRPRRRRPDRPRRRPSGATTRAPPPPPSPPTRPASTPSDEHPPRDRRRRPGRAPGHAPGPRAGWPVMVALVGLSAVPVTAGTLRLLQLTGGAQVHAGRCPDGRVTCPGRGPRRRRRPLRARGCRPAAAAVPSRPPVLAPSHGPRRRRRRPPRGRVGAVDDAASTRRSRAPGPCCSCCGWGSPPSWPGAWSSASRRSVAATSRPTVPG